MTDLLLARLEQERNLLSTLDGLSRFQWLELLVSRVVDGATTAKICKAARQQTRSDGSDLGLMRDKLTKLLPTDASPHQASLVSRIAYAASQTHTSRNNSTVQFLSYVDTDLCDLILGGGGPDKRSTLLPLFKWIQFNFSSGYIEQGVCEGVDLRAAGGGLLESELQLIGQRFDKLGAILWFYTLTPALQHAICDVWINQRGSKF